MAFVACGGGETIHVFTLLSWLGTADDDADSDCMSFEIVVLDVDVEDSTVESFLPSFAFIAFIVSIMARILVVVDVVFELLFPVVPTREASSLSAVVVVVCLGRTHVLFKDADDTENGG